MSTKVKRVCPKLRDACIFAFIVQLFLLAITNLATDGGYIGQIYRGPVLHRRAGYCAVALLQDSPRL